MNQEIKKDCEHPYIMIDMKTGKPKCFNCNQPVKLQSQKAKNYSKIITDLNKK